MDANAVPALTEPNLRNILLQYNISQQVLRLHFDCKGDRAGRTRIGVKARILGVDDNFVHFRNLEPEYFDIDDFKRIVENDAAWINIQRINFITEM